MGGTLHGIDPYRRNHVEPGRLESRTQSPAPAKRSMPKGLIPCLFFVLTFVNICLVSTIVNCLHVVDRTLAMCRRLNRPLSGKNSVRSPGKRLPGQSTRACANGPCPHNRAPRARKKKKVSPETRSSPCSKVVDNVHMGSVIFSDQCHIGLAPQGFGQEQGVTSQAK